MGIGKSSIIGRPGPKAQKSKNLSIYDVTMTNSSDEVAGNTIDNNLFGDRAFPWDPVFRIYLDTLIQVRNFIYTNTTKVVATSDQSSDIEGGRGNSGTYPDISKSAIFPGVDDCTDGIIPVELTMPFEEFIGKSDEPFGYFYRFRATTDFSSSISGVCKALQVITCQVWIVGEHDIDTSQTKGLDYTISVKKVN